MDDVPRLWFKTIRGSVETIKPREVLKNQIPLPDNSSQLPDNLPSVFDDLTLADDKQTILSKGNNTGIKLDDVSDYLDGARDAMMLTLVFVVLQLLLIPLLPRHRFGPGDELPLADPELLVLPDLHDAPAARPRRGGVQPGSSMP